MDIGQNGAPGAEISIFIEAPGPRVYFSDFRGRNQFQTRTTVHSITLRTPEVRRAKNKRRWNSLSPGSKPDPLDQPRLTRSRPKTVTARAAQSCHDLGRDQRPASALPVKKSLKRVRGYRPLKSHLRLSEIRSNLVCTHVYLT